MNKKINIFNKLAPVLLLLLVLLSSQIYAQTSPQTVKFWSRGDLFYLASGSAMPIWPQLPQDSSQINKTKVLLMEMPADFKIIAAGESNEFALHPKPLIVPTKIDALQKNDKVIYSILLPAEEEKEHADTLKYNKKDRVIRAALLIDPGNTPPGEYSVKVGLKTQDGQTTWTDLNAKAIVLPKLKGKRPQRLRMEVFDYAGYKNPVFKKAIKDAFLASGINAVSNMVLYESNDTIAQQLRPFGVKANALIFWHKIGMALAKQLPDILTLDKDGNPMQITDAWPVNASVCHTWCIQNPEKFKNALVEYFKKTVIGKYDGITNDNEEKAFTRDKKEIKGDLYTPITMQLFKKHARIDPCKKLTPEIITEKYADQWVDFRCWQSAKMSALASEALAEIDPAIAYGYYSGHKYSGSLAGFTRYMYATDWDVLAEIGGLHFGSSGYYGSPADFTETTNALDGIPHIPAEMFIENFVAFNRAMPTPDDFTYRLMKSVMYGSGGVAVWYAQVLDAAAYSAIAKVSAVTTEIENFLLDGTRCDKDLAIPPMFDKKAVFAYKLGEKRCVVVFNHSGKNKKIRLSWRTFINKPDTVELVTKRQLAASKVLDANLKPHSFAVFVTLSEGN